MDFGDVMEGEGKADEELDHFCEEDCGRGKVPTVAVHRSDSCVVQRLPSNQVSKL